MRRLAEAAVFDFLKPVSESKDKDITTDSRRVAIAQAPPFATQFLKSERPKAVDLALDRSRIQTGHRYAAGGAATFRFGLDLGGFPTVTR